MPRVALPRGIENDGPLELLVANERLLVTALCCYVPSTHGCSGGGVQSEGSFCSFSIEEDIPLPPFFLHYPLFRRLTLPAPPPPSLLPSGHLPRLLCKGPCPASESRPLAPSVVGWRGPVPRPARPWLLKSCTSHRLPRQAWGGGGRRRGGGARHALWSEGGGGCSERGMGEHALRATRPLASEGGGQAGGRADLRARWHGASTERGEGKIAAPTHTCSLPVSLKLPPPPPPSFLSAPFHLAGSS